MLIVKEMGERIAMGNKKPSSGRSLPDEGSRTSFEARLREKARMPRPEERAHPKGRG
jgi:hypothetical protein